MNFQLSDTICLNTLLNRNDYYNKTSCLGHEVLYSYQKSGLLAP